VKLCFNWVDDWIQRQTEILWCAKAKWSIYVIEKKMHYGVMWYDNNELYQQW